MYVTLIDISNILEAICNAHAQVHSYYFDDIEDILEKKDIQYTSVFAVPLSVIVEKSLTTFNIQLIVLDKIDKANERDMQILEHCRRVMLDIIAELELKVKGISLRLDRSAITFTDVKDKFNDDDIVGWIANVAIYVPNELEACGIPYVMPPGVVLQENNFPLLLEN